MSQIIPPSQAQANLTAKADTSKLYQKLKKTNTPMPTQTNKIAKYIFIACILWCVTGFFTAANQDIGAKNAKAQVRQELSTSLGMPIENIGIVNGTEVRKVCDLATTTTRCK
jgi:hypothetical protein